MAASERVSPHLSWIKRLHGQFVLQRRAQVLAEMLAAALPQSAKVVDVGCGDGAIGRLIANLRPDISIQGLEYKVREGCKIECRPFDGSHLPFPDAAFDVCLFVDVLHHTQDVSLLLGEAVRVTRSFVLIKDHLNENVLDDATLRFMDWVGNRPHGVVLTYNYQSRKQWNEHFSRMGLESESWTSALPIYASPFNFIFGRKLHFISLLRKTGQKFLRNPAESHSAGKE